MPELLLAPFVITRAILPLNRVAVAQKTMTFQLPKIVDSIFNINVAAKLIKRTKSKNLTVVIKSVGLPMLYRN